MFDSSDVVGLSASVSKRPDGIRSQQLAEFWSRLRVSEELGATTWDVLEPLEREVTEALDQDPPDFIRADSATAKAFCLISGVNEF